MADLIDRQAVLAEMRRSGRAAYMIVQEASAVDAVEVVRCGECRYCDTPECPMSGTEGRVSASDYCSYGERRTDNE